MNCFTHSGTPAVGLCSLCQKAVCHKCVGQDTPRVVCRDCAARGALQQPRWLGPSGLGYGFSYKSAIAIGSWPLLHVCTGIDPITMRPAVARGVIAIGNIAVGIVAVGGLACGLVTLGGASIGLLLAVGGAALGVGVSVGGLAVGSVALGGAAVGFVYALGGGALGPAAIDGRHCDEAAREFFRRWLDVVPRTCG